MTQTSHIEIYQYDDGQKQVEVRLVGDTLWLSQAQIAELFDKDTDTIGLHLKNIYAEGELDELATAEEFSVVRQEGRRQVRRKIRFYNLDAAISVGYRANQQRFEHNASELEQAPRLIRRTAQSPELRSE